MKILVIDDTQLHLDAARQTLAGHALTLVKTYDEAHKVLEVPHANWDAVEGAIKRRGFKGTHEQGASEEERAATWAERRRLEVELCPPPRFDAVLCDLLMPASRTTMGDKGMEFVGQEMPVGFALSLMAVLAGAKHIAVVTATNHHDHPASAMFDRLQSGNWNEGVSTPKFHINGAVVDYVHAPMVHMEGTTCPDCNGTGSKEACYCVERNAGSPKSDCDTCNGTGHQCWTCRNSGKQWGKDWGKVLARLLGQG